MILLVSGSTKSVSRLAGQSGGRLGHLLTPKNRCGVRYVLQTGLPWAVDNGAFNCWNPVAFRRLLGRVERKPRLLFIACPDRVGDARATLELFDAWADEVAAAGPVAFVAQDGQEALPVPWERFSALFVGGSTAWKLSKAAQDLSAEAKRRGKWLHVGRVNSKRRMRFCWSMKADSIDGSSASMFGNIKIPKYLDWLGQMMPWPA